VIGKNKPQCGICGSHNIQRIEGTDRWFCNHCKSVFNPGYTYCPSCTKQTAYAIGYQGEVKCDHCGYRFNKQPRVFGRARMFLPDTHYKSWVLFLQKMKSIEPRKPGGDYSHARRMRIRMQKEGLTKTQALERVVLGALINYHIFREISRNWREDT